MKAKRGKDLFFLSRLWCVSGIFLFLFFSSFCVYSCVHVFVFFCTHQKSWWLCCFKAKGHDNLQREAPEWSNRNKHTHYTRLFATTTTTTLPAAEERRGQQIKNNNNHQKKSWNTFFAFSYKRFWRPIKQLGSSTRTRVWKKVIRKKEKTG